MFVFIQTHVKLSLRARVWNSTFEGADLGYGMWRM